MGDERGRLLLWHPIDKGGMRLMALTALRREGEFCGSSRSILEDQFVLVRSRSAFAITETELKLMAAAAIIGRRRRPNAG